MLSRLTALALLCLVPATLDARDAATRPSDVQALLQNTTLDMEFDKVPLPAALEVVRARLNVNLHVDWKALSAAGIDKDTAISLNLREVRAAKALTMLLDDAANGNAKLGFMVDENVLRISTEEALDKDHVTRSYDVKDLIALRRDHPLDAAVIPPTRLIRPHMRDWARGVPHPGENGGISGVGGGVGGGMGNAMPEVESPMQGLVKLIQDTVQPDCWRDNGGPGSIRELDGQIIMSASISVHEQVRDLLALLRSTSAHTVTIRAHWVLIAPADLVAVTKPLDKSSLQEVDLAAIEKLGNKAVHHQAQTNCMNGQLVHIASGQAHTVVTRANAVVGTGAVAYDPESEIVQAGAFLQIRPTVAADNTGALIDVESCVSEWNDDKAAKAVTRPAGEIDRLEMHVQQMQTTVVVPLNKPVLVSAASFNPSSKEGDGKKLCLIVEVSAAKTLEKP